MICENQNVQLALQTAPPPSTNLSGAVSTGRNALQRYLATLFVLDL